MKCRPIKVWLIFYGLIVLTGCDESLKIDNPGDYKIAVTGELVAGQHSILHLAKSGTVSPVSAPQPIDAAEVSITHTITGKRFMYHSTGDGYWLCDGFMPEAKQSYQIKINTPETKVEGLATVPDVFDVHAEMTEGELKTIALHFVNADNNDYKYIVNIQSRPYEVGSGINPVFTGNWEDVQILCEDKKTDNVIYGELDAPYSKVFFQHIYNQKITFSPEKQEGLRKYRVIVKSVDPIYYNYVYTYECMKAFFSGNSNVIPLQSNINNGLGIFGGVFQKVMIL